MLTEEEIRKHFQHKCNTGFDPLLCIHLIYYPTFIDRNTKTGQMSIRKDIDNIKKNLSSQPTAFMALGSQLSAKVTSWLP